VKEDGKAGNNEEDLTKGKCVGEMHGEKMDRHHKEKNEGNEGVNGMREKALSLKICQKGRLIQIMLCIGWRSIRM